jgi:hypothetical protein
MARSSLIRFASFACLATWLSLGSCAAPTSSGPGTGGDGATAGSGGTSSAGTNGTAGTSGNAGRGGTSATAGTGGSSTAGTGGSATAGTGGTAAIRMDCKNQLLAKAGDMTSASKAYLNLGDMRLINNRWGSDELGCTGTTQRVFINSDKTFGWEFNRPVCGGAKAKPDYPEVEFGVAPFGPNSTLLTTPSCSTTTLLPKQIKDITSASVKVDSLAITLPKPTVWNIDFEMWLASADPTTTASPTVVAEIIVFWGWETGRWACDKTGTVTAGNNTYTLCHQSDDWSTGHWKFYQFNVQGGPFTSYSGTVDIKALTDFVVNTYGLSRDNWVTRFEVGSEIDDNTMGSVKVKNLTFSVNGTAKSIELQP